MINEAIIKLINKENLTEDMAKKVMDEIMSGGNRSRINKLIPYGAYNERGDC